MCIRDRSIGSLKISSFEYANIHIGKAMSNFGAFLVLVASMNLLYEAFQKKTFMEEIRFNVIGSKSVVDAGLVEYNENSKRYDFSKLIYRSTKITTLFNFSSRFLDDYQNDLIKFLKSDGELELIYLKPKGEAMNEVVSIDYGNAEIGNNRLHDSKSKLNQIIQELEKHGKLNKIEVDALIKYAAIMFDNDGFIIFRTSSKGRREVPMLHFTRGHHFWEFIYNDIERLRSNHV